jgi:hypothetical protein
MYKNKMEKLKEDYTATDAPDEISTLLSDIHDALLLPFEFIAYCICALLHPRYTAIITESTGRIGTFLIDGNIILAPQKKTTLGPVQNTSTDENTITALITMVPLYSKNNITLYENYLIASDQNNTISCYSFTQNAWLSHIPLTQKEQFPLSYDAERKLVSIIHIPHLNPNIVLFIYSDTILLYNIASHTWVLNEEDDPYGLAFFTIPSLSSLDSPCISCQFDNHYAALIFLDRNGNIASYGLTEKQEIDFLHVQGGAADIIQDNIKCVIVRNYGELTEGSLVVLFILYNDSVCQLLEYQQNSGVTLSNTYTFCDEGACIVDVINFEEERKVHIIYSNQKIVELSTYEMKPIVIQKAIAGDEKVIRAYPSFTNEIPASIYITNHHAVYIAYLIQGIHRVGKLAVHLTPYVSEEAFITEYLETFIQSSSLSIFIKEYYGLAGYINAFKYMLTQRT